MLVKDQIKSRMEQLGIKVPALAKAIGVSEQSVRFWLNGRNIPGKRHRAPLEAALSCSINWAEHDRKLLNDQIPADAMLDKADIEIMFKLSRLPAPVKILLGQLAEQIHQIAGGTVGAGFTELETVKPMKAFSVKSKAAHGSTVDGKTSRRHPPTKTKKTA